MMGLHEELVRGDVVRVAFGSKGSQVAVVTGRTAAGNVYAYKFSAKQKRWKGPMRLFDTDLIGRADLRTLSSLPRLPA